ncbi:MAG: flippase, partial [Calditrichaeota bacterium]
MSFQRKVLNQSLIYSFVSIGTILAGFISFPIWTRLLSPEEYGIYNLIIVSIGFLTTFSKAGLQKAVIRFYSEFAAGRNGRPISVYYSTMLVGSLIAGCFFSVLFVALASVFQSTFSLGVSTKTLLLLIAVIVVMLSLNSVLISFFRVEQRAVSFTILSFIHRYGNIGASVLFAIGLKMGMVGLFIGQALIETVVAVGCIARLLWRKELFVKHFSLKFLREALSFGIPLMPVESSKWILAYMDRFVIQIFMGAAAVGFYSVGYNMTLYFSTLLAAPFNLAITPMYLDIWEKHGREKTTEFLNSVLDYFLMLAIPLICAFSFLGGDLIDLLASSKYHGASVVLPYLVIPIVLNASYTVFGAGLLIYKKTKLVMYYTFVAGGVNIALNFLLIPKFGLMGAAVATLIAYTVLFGLTIVSASKYLRLSVNPKSVLGYVAASMVMMWMLSSLSWSTM